nr:hypothetical protein [Tanacetum cinerariifolium]
MVDYDDEYHQDDIQTNSEDPLISAMLLLARAITQNFTNLTNNRLRTSSNTRNQAVIQGDQVNNQSKNSGNAGRNNRRAYVPEEWKRTLCKELSKAKSLGLEIFHGTNVAGQTG